MAWTMEISQFPLSISLANGIASHAFWVLKNDGVVVAELQGLATDKNDDINPMGGHLDLSDRHLCRWHEFRSEHPDLCQ